MTVSVWNDQEVIRVRPGKVEHVYGLAIDVGTTTVAGYFCDLATMEVVDTVTLMNPQCKYGEDVMARITFHMTTEDGLERMSDDIIEGLNWLIDEAIKNTYPPKKKVKKPKDYEGPDSKSRCLSHRLGAHRELGSLSVFWSGPGGNHPVFPGLPTPLHHLWPA